MKKNEKINEGLENSTFKVEKQNDLTSKKISLHPNYILRSLRNNNYDTESAISELVDNSIDAHANNITISIPSKEDLRVGSKPIIISDDGDGMSMSELQSSFDLGSTREYTSDDIGIYGSGMKASSAYLSQYTMVETKKEGDILKNVAIWDIENKPLLIDYYTVEDKKIKKGTKITLFTKYAGNSSPSRLENFTHTQAAYIKKKSGTRYYHAITSEKISPDAKSLPKLKININGSEIIPSDPMHRDDSNVKTWFEEVKVNIDEVEYKIDIKGYYLGYIDKKSSDSRESGHSFDKQGVYLLLSNKYIQLGGGWLGARQSQHGLNETRVEVSVPKELIEYFGISVNKNSSVDIAHSSEENQLSVHSEKKHIVDAINRIASWGLQEAIIKRNKAKSKNPDDKKQAATMSLDINQKFKKIGLSKQGPGLDKLPNRVPKNNENDEKKQKERKSGLTYNKDLFVIDFHNGSKESKFWNLEREGRKVVISFNKEHAFYDKYLNNENRDIMVEFLCAMAMSEMNTYQNSEHAMDDWNHYWYNVSVWVDKLSKLSNVDDFKSVKSVKESEVLMS